MIDLLVYTVLSLALGVGVLSMLVAKGKHGPAFRWLGVYLLWSFAVQASGQWSSMTYKSNMILYNLSIPVFFFVLYMLFRALDTPWAYRRNMDRVFLVWTVPMLIVVLPVLVKGSFASQDMSQGIMVINLTVVTAALMYLYHMLQHPELTPPSRQAPFLVAMAFFFYFFCSFLSWASYSLFSGASKDVAELIGTVNIVLVLLLYLLLAWGVWVQWKTLRKSGK